jgi:hypothetical protein
VLAWFPGESRTRWLALVLTLAALAGAGHGPQAARAATAAEATKAEFVAQLNRICEDRYRALVKLGPFVIPRDYAQRGRKLIRIERDSLAAADALERPPDDAPVDRARAEAVAYQRLLPRVVSAARRHQRKAWRLMYRAHAHLDLAGEIIRAYGATSCTNPW